MNENPRHVSLDASERGGREENIASDNFEPLRMNDFEVLVEHAPGGGQNVAVFDQHAATELIRAIDDDAATVFSPLRFNSTQHRRQWLLEIFIGSRNAENFFNRTISFRLRPQCIRELLPAIVKIKNFIIE